MRPPFFPRRSIPRTRPSSNVDGKQFSKAQHSPRWTLSPHASGPAWFKTTLLGTYLGIDGLGIQWDAPTLQTVQQLLEVNFYGQIPISATLGV